MKRFLLILLLLAVTVPAWTQPRLELRHLKPNVPRYYYYQLFIAASCGDSVIYDLRKGQLIFEEAEGRIDTNDYQIDRPASPTRNSCYDLAMVFDNSSTITASALTQVTAAAGLYVDAMSLECQHASVVSFADRPTLRTFLTNDREALRGALTGMTPSGRRALYDAIYTGFIDLETNGRQPLRIVLAVTTGNDNASSAEMEYIIERAQYDDIRVYIIGLGTGLSAQPLQELCQRTGGLYFPVASADELEVLYPRLAGFFQREFDEHRIVRRTRALDMTNLLVRMRLEACSDSMWVQRVFNPFVVTGVDRLPRPASFSLGQSYPNPVSSAAGSVQFRFAIAPEADGDGMRLQLFDGLGRLVATVFDRSFPTGEHTVPWQLPSLRPGVYHYRLSGGSEVVSGRMTVVP